LRVRPFGANSQNPENIAQLFCNYEQEMNKMLARIWQRKISKLTGAIFSLFCLSTFCNNDFVAIAQPKYSRYGLGAEIRQTGSLHALPTYCVVAIAPEDGGRTISENPSIYIYLLKRHENYNASLHVLGLNFRISADKDFSSRRVLNEKVRNLQLNAGFYKITLPIVKPPVLNGKVQYWTTFVIDSGRMWSDYARTYIQRETDANLLREIRGVKTLLEQAQIYAKYYYWYDAFDAYSQWLEANPNDFIARRDRKKMLQENLLHDKCDDYYRFTPSTKKLWELIEANPAKEIKLLPRK